MRNSDASSDQTGRALSRRKWLALSAASVAGLAGCSGGNPSSGNATSSNGTSGSATSQSEASAQTNSSTSNATAATTGELGEPVEPVADLALDWGWQPQESNFNIFSVVGNIPWTERVLYLNEKQKYDYRSREWKPIATEKVPEVNDCETVISLDSDYSWWDDTPLRADDAIASWKLGYWYNQGNPETAPVDYEKVDEKTYRILRDGPQSRNVALDNTAGPITARKEVAEPWLQKFRDASGDQAIEDVRTELNNQKWSFDFLKENDMGYGLWYPETVETTEVVHTKHEGHPAAERTNIEKFRQPVVPDSQKRGQLVQRDRLDLGVLSDPYAKGPDYLKPVAQFQKPQPISLGFNIGSEQNSLALRRAIAYLVDLPGLQRIVQNGYDLKRQTCNGHNTLHTPQSAKEQLPQSFRDKLIDYGKRAQPEKAAEEMRKAGYTKKNGVWRTPDGKKLDGYKVITPNWTWWTLVTETVAGWINDFGIGTDFVTPGSFFNTLRNGDFDVSILSKGWGNFPGPSQTYFLWHHRGIGDYMGSTKTNPEEEEDDTCEYTPPVPGEDFTFTDDRSVNFEHPVDPRSEAGKQWFAYPNEVGSKEISGSGQMLKPYEYASVLESVQDEERRQNAINQFAHWSNYKVHTVDMIVQKGGVWMDTKNFNLVENHDLYTHPGTNLMATGQIVGESK